ERGAYAEGDHRHAMSGACAHDLLHFLRRFRKCDAVRRLRRDIGGGVGGLPADRLPGQEAFAETLLEDAKDRRDAFLVTLDTRHVAQSHAFLREWTSARLAAALWMRSLSRHALSSVLPEGSFDVPARPLRFRSDEHRKGLDRLQR